MGRKKIPITLKTCLSCGNKIPKWFSKTTGKEISIKAYQRREFCNRKCANTNGFGARWGQKASIETRKKMSDAKKGDKCVLWKGGITKISKSIRNTLKYRLWRESIFKRDDYTCQLCKNRGVALNADHIKQFAFYPELRFELSNGRTLCVECHKTTDSYLSKGLKLKIQ